MRRENGHDEPWTWVRTYGKGRVFYTAWGHDQRTWGNEGFQALLERGNYVADRALATALYLALKLGRPLFLEGEAGVGCGWAVASGWRPGGHGGRPDLGLAVPAEDAGELGTVGDGNPIVESLGEHMDVAVEAAILNTLQHVVLAHGSLLLPLDGYVPHTVAHENLLASVVPFRNELFER